MTTTNKKADFSKYLGQPVIIYFQGGRQVSGTLRGCDDVANLVLDNSVEYIRNTSHAVTTRERKLGLVIIRGLAVECLCGSQDMMEIENPYT